MNQTNIMKKVTNTASTIGLYLVALALAGCGNKDVVQTKKHEEAVSILRKIPHTKFNFKNGSHTLSKLQKSRIAETAQYLQDNPDIFIIVTGYASKTGPSDKNMALSLRRAEAVKNELIKHNPSLEKRIKMEAAGENEVYKFKSDAKARSVIISLNNDETKCCQVSKM